MKSDHTGTLLELLAGSQDLVCAHICVNVCVSCGQFVLPSHNSLEAGAGLTCPSSTLNAGLEYGSKKVIACRTGDLV